MRRHTDAHTNTRSICTPTYMHTHTHIPTYIHTYIQAYIYTYIVRTYVRTYIHTCIHKYVRTYVYIYIYIHTYMIHIYIRTYIHTYVQCVQKRMVQFQKLIRNLFLTLHGQNVHRQQRQLSQFRMRYQQFFFMLTAGPRGQFLRWRRSRKRFSVCSVLRCPDL